MVAVQQGPWKHDARSPRYEDFRAFSPADWQGSRAPAYDWMVDGCFLRGTVAILAGDGGLGKSLLCQQLCTAAAVGRAWLGLPVARVRSLALFCEDDRDELQRRQEAINRYYDCSMADLEDVMILDRAGRDSVLMRFGRWGDEGHTTPAFEKIKLLAEEHGAQILILDTVADVFSGNEIDRNQPRTFVRLLRRWALERQGVVILTQHPSVAGMSEGSGRSGSTGWRNSVRSMVYLTKDKKDEDGNNRVLKTMKMNAGKSDGKYKLTWHKGVFVRIEETFTSYNPPEDGWPE